MSTAPIPVPLSAKRSATKTTKRAPAPDNAVKIRSATKRHARHKLASCADIYLSSPLERVEMIRNRLPSSAIAATSKLMGISRERLYEMLNFSRATVARKTATQALLSKDMSERLLGLRRLIGQIEVMVRDYGDGEGFNAAHWLARWLDESVPALGGIQPRVLMDTVAGQEIVANLLARAVSGAYA